MKQKDNVNDIEIRSEALTLAADAGGPNDGRERRELMVMQADGRLFAVFADEADNVSEGHTPTPLPNAPPAVLGVVCVRGRMRTLLDAAPLLDAKAEGERPVDEAADALEEAASRAAAGRRLIVSLRGDDQLALAVERVERITEIFLDEVELDEHAATPTRGYLPSAEGARTFILDPSRLFDAAMQGAERRRIR